MPVDREPDVEPCIGCGLPSVVRLEDKFMCGHCFHLGLTLARSQEIHRASGTAPETDVPADLRSTVDRALREFSEVKGKVEELLRVLERSA